MAKCAICSKGRHVRQQRFPLEQKDQPDLEAQHQKGQGRHRRQQQDDLRLLRCLRAGKVTRAQ